MSDPTPTQAEADALKLQGHGAAATDLPPAVVDVPAVTGTGTVGSTLACTMGNWTSEPTGFTYEWRADTTNVLGSGESYVVDEVAVGHEVCCVVTATNAFGSTQAPPSNAIAITAAAARAERAAPAPGGRAYGARGSPMKAAKPKPAKRRRPAKPQQPATRDMKPGPGKPGYTTR